MFECLVSVSETVWGGLGRVALLEEVSQCRVGFEVSKNLAPPSVLSRLPVHESGCELAAVSATMPFPHHHGL